MGTSTDAILMYGISFADEDGDSLNPFHPEEEEEDEDWDFEDMVLAKFFPEIGSRPDGEYGENPAIATWYADKKAAFDSIGIELESHCSSDYPMYVLCIQGSNVTAHRGYPKTFDVLPIADPSWDKRLRDFCAAFNVEVSADPCWVLASSWSN